MSSNGIADWWNGIPAVTRVMMASMVGTTLAAHFKLVPPRMLIWDAGLVWQKFHLWRVVTSFVFFGGLGLPFLMNLVFFYRYSSALERELIGSTADFVWVLMIGGCILLSVGHFFRLVLLGECLIFFIVYLWARLAEPGMMNFLFGITIPKTYFPWVMLAFNLIMGGNPIPPLAGILVGHLIFFLKYLYPVSHPNSVAWTNTPLFLKRLFPPARGPAIHQLGQTRPSVDPPTRASPSRFDGGGHRLGTSSDSRKDR